MIYQTKKQGLYLKQAPSSFKKLRHLWHIPIGIVLVVGVIMSFMASPKASHAAPFATCNTNGLLYQYPNGTDTTVYSIDMVTGQSTPPSTPTPTPQISGRTINAVGYNVKDNFVYGWDNTSHKLVRIHQDYSVDEITINGFTTTTNIIIGDVDENGYYWFIVGNGATNGETYHAVDLNSGTSTVDLVPGIGTGTLSGMPANHSAGADWAYVPGGSGLYRVMHDQVNNQGRVMVFDRNTGAFSSVGLIPQSELPSSDLKEGAFYADSDGFLYASDNDDGNIYRVNIANANKPVLDTDLFASGPASSANDGARCADAPIPIDFGDAPDGYKTLLASDGPRHGIVDFDAATNTAPLMLGKKVDIETDGFPGTDAYGDDDNNIDDEEGVSHIVATPGTPTALSIPVTVTNNGSQSATLAGWIDLDASGTFDTGERVTATIPANSGTKVYELNFPTTTFTANSMSRFRVLQGSVADPQPTGAATGGEVEDHLVQVGSYEVTKTASPASGTTVMPGDTVTYTLNIRNTGLTDLLNLSLDDYLTDVLDDATLVGNPRVDPASGMATLDNDTLKVTYTGDILSGQSVKITYSVKVNAAANLANSSLHNMVVATHSSCHPDVVDGTVTVDDPSCVTTHPISGSLADTGNNFTLLLLAGSSLIIASIAVIVGQRKKLLGS